MNWPGVKNLKFRDLENAFFHHEVVRAQQWIEYEEEENFLDFISYGVLLDKIIIYLFNTFMHAWQDRVFTPIWPQ